MASGIVLKPMLIPMPKSSGDLIMKANLRAEVWSLGLLLLLVTGTVQAQRLTACPPGMIPYGAGVCGYDQSDQPAQQAPLPSPTRWRPMYGAIALYAPKGVLGSAANLPNQSEANVAAIQDCRAKGGTDCKIELSYGNECAAMVVGDPGYNVTPGETMDIAQKKAMRLCTDAGDKNCHVYFTACSLPKRLW